jgi:hypothetical protein
LQQVSQTHYARLRVTRPIPARNKRRFGRTQFSGTTSWKAHLC